MTESWQLKWPEDLGMHASSEPSTPWLNVPQATSSIVVLR